jgi:hypothetical protein
MTAIGMTKDAQITLRHLTVEQIRELCVLAAAFETDRVAIGDKTGRDWSLESDELIRLPSSQSLVRYVLALDPAAREELIAVHLYHVEVKPTFEECRRRAAKLSIEYLLCEPLVELLGVLSGLLPIERSGPAVAVRAG